MTASRYLSQHFAVMGIQLLILSDDPDFATKHSLTNTELRLIATGEAYVSSLTTELQELEDKLCRIPYNEDECKRYVI